MRRVELPTGCCATANLILTTKFLRVPAVPHKDVFWYCLNGTVTENNAPKGRFSKIFSCIFICTETKWNSL